MSTGVEAIVEPTVEPPEKPVEEPKGRGRLRGKESGRPRSKLSTEEVEPYEAMKWVLTHKVGQDETVQHRSYREWLKESRAAFMADFARRERERAPVAAVLVEGAPTQPVVPEEDLGVERSLRVLEHWLEGYGREQRNERTDEQAGAVHDGSGGTGVAAQGVDLP